MNHGNRLVWTLTTVASVLTIGVLVLGPELSATSSSLLQAPSTEVSPEPPVGNEVSAGTLQPLKALSEVAGRAQTLVIQQEGNDWLELTREDKGEWQIASLAQWPARQDKVAALLEALASARVRGQKPASDKSLAALGLTDDSPVLVVSGGDRQVRLQLGDKPTAAPVEGGDGTAKPLAGRFVRWLSGSLSSESLAPDGNDSPVLELTSDIGLPDWRGGMATPEVLDLEALLKSTGSRLPSRVEVTLANDSTHQAGIRQAGLRKDSASQSQALTHGLAPQGTATSSLLAALSSLKQNDLRLRQVSDSTAAGWQPEVTLALHWTSASTARIRIGEHARATQQLSLAIAQGSKPWARLTLSGSGWPAALVARLDQVEIQVNGALRERLMVLAMPTQRDDAESDHEPPVVEGQIAPAAIVAAKALWGKE